MGTASPAVAPSASYARWWRLPWPRYSLPGVTGALLLGAASFTPSLAPRTWAVQGVVNGLGATVGYAAGVLAAWLVRTATGWSLPARIVPRMWVALAVVGTPLLAWAMTLGQRWQREIHQLTGASPPDSYAWVRIMLLSVAVVVVLVGVGRALRWTVRLLSRGLVRVLPQRVAAPMAVLIVLAVLVGVNNGLVWRGLLSAADSTFGAANRGTDTGVTRPASPERSGSPASLVSWASLGRQGRSFVALGPTVADLSAFSGRPATEPVRAYVGLRSAPSTHARARLAVRELERTGAFDRAVLVVATTTGTGYVDPSAAAAVEYLYNGDTAIVGLQYSYLPSWISFLVDAEKAQEAGRELFNTVYDAWAVRPAGHRPRLLVTATSLGVYGSEAAFGGLADIRNRTDGVVWAGPTYSGGLHRQLVEQRDPGSPEWLPVYDGGHTVRFVSSPADVWAPGRRWDHPRVVYLQYGSDAVVRWTPLLAFSKPDWLSEPRAPDVSADMRWLPVVTFWQVTADLPSTYAVPDGHGHRYSELYADAWVAVAAPPGWTGADTDRLREQIRRDRLERDGVVLTTAGAPARP